MMRLSEQKIGFKGEVKSLEGDALFLSRLRELGFIRGERIELVGRAPFGDPFLVQAGNATVALRREEAACILV